MKNFCLNFCLMIVTLLGSTGTVFASDLPACPSSGYFHNCFGSATDANGSKYVGEFKDGKPNGQGTVTFAIGGKYVGEFRDGKKHGQGIYTDSHGNKYVGEFSNDNLNGQGILTDPDGRIVNEGIWKNNEFQYAKKVGPKT